MRAEIKQRIKQIKNGEIPDGYRSTKAGVLPKWDFVRLNQIAEPITKKVGNGTYETLSISAGIGFVNQAKKFGKELSGKQYEKYTVLKRGDFSYNKGNSKTYPQGCIYRLKDRETAAVPNVFESFKIKKDSPDYYEQLFTSGYLNKQLSKKINHGVRDNGLLNLTEKDFYSCYVPHPPIAEQQKIAEILMQCDKLIELYQNETYELQKLKKICLCNMFPKNGNNVPEWRFPQFTDAWEQRKLGELGTITTGSTPSTSIPDYYSDDGIVWVTPTDICENITFESARKLSDLGQQVGRVVPKNTILVTCIASIGKNTMLGNTGSFNQQINGLTPNENECAPYFLLTESALWSAKMKSSAAAGTMQIVNRTEFSELKTWLPNLIEQQAISDFFRQLDNLITLHQRKLAEMEKYKKSLMQLLLTGIVRV